MVLDINGSNTLTLQTGSPFIFTESVPPINLITSDRIPVATKNQNKKTTAFPTAAEKMDNMNTPTIIIMGA